jgi:hypothetical protein
MKKATFPKRRGKKELCRSEQALISQKLELEREILSCL